MFLGHGTRRYFIDSVIYFFDVYPSPFYGQLILLFQHIPRFSILLVLVSYVRVDAVC